VTQATPSAALQEALTLHRSGDLPGAIARYELLLRDQPDNADALYYLAIAAYQQGRLDDGLRLAARALQGPPEQPRIHYLIGQILTRAGKREDAIASYDRAIALDPNYADAHGNRANVLSELGRYEEALAGFDRALAIRADSPEDWCNRGATLQDFDRPEEALASYERALTLSPKLAGAHLARGNLLRDLAQIAQAAGRGGDSELFDASEAAFAEALALNPQYSEAYLGRGFLRLIRGDWAAGFRDYEHRVNVGPPTFAPLPYPRWQGEPLPGGRLVLVTEQGLGDAMFFGRFAPLLAARGFDVTILTKEGMRPLLSTLAGVKIATSVNALASDDRPIRWLPLMSVPGVLGLTRETIPSKVPYLAPDPARVALWTNRLGPEGFKIGITWGSGHQAVRSFTRRNIPLAAFSPLAALPGVRLFALQKVPALRDVDRCAFGDRIEVLPADPYAQVDLFLDTAAVMTCLDLVVSCDTSIAHLAGALARPVFCALPATADWRWLHGRDDSPWYPTMRLFRQRAPGDWTDVMARIARAAAELIPVRR
jgi:tetratricopeptide (TPR) repeat protein